MNEAQYKMELIPRIEQRFPGCLILLNDANYLQGIPDMSVFFRELWALLEVKISADAKERPNQRYYIEHWGEHTFTAFIYPENEEEVLDALERYFQQASKH